MDRSVQWFYTDLTESALWKLSGARCIRRLMKMMESCRRPYPEAQRQIATMVYEYEKGWQYDEMMSVMLLWHISARLDHHVAAKAEILVKRTGLQWEIERRRRGRYPPATSPADPFTGKPLIYDPAKGTLSSAGYPATDKSLEEEREELAWKLLSPLQAGNGK